MIRSWQDIERRHPGLRGVRHPALLRTACSLIAAIGLNLGLQAGALSPSAAVSYLVHRSGPMLLGSLLTWFVLMAFWSVLGRLAISIGILASVTLTIAWVSAEKIRLRREPLFPSDLAFADNASFLLSQVSPSTIVLVATGVVATTVTCVILGRLVTRRIGRWRTSRTRSLGVRLGVAVLMTALLSSAVGFNDEGNRLRSSYETAGAFWAPANQIRNVMLNGVVGGFLYNSDVPAMTRPPGYSREAMAAIVARYGQAVAPVENRVLAETNVVVILGEAFADPTRLRGFRLAQDPIPFTRDLMNRTPSGTMLTQMVGAGTANMEFEVLTGQSLGEFDARMNTPYQMLIPGQPTFPSSVGYFESLGHEARAIHPYNANMYQRQSVYPVLGFDEFVDETRMTHRGSVGNDGLISDEATFDEVMDKLRTGDEPQFLNVVTMQNHYDYERKFDDPFHVEGLDARSADAVGNYARGLAYTDQALDRLVTRLESLDEPTAVVFYGDHLPAAYPESVFEANGELGMRQTPFFLWSNTQALAPEDLGTTSPIHFLPLLADRLGAELPPYYALLLELQREIPAMAQGLYLDETGEPMAEDDLSARARQLLRDYRLVQYDLSVGARYSQDELFYPSDVTSAASE